MKALKEKRVSLRSFLRRGLVILSLFALVFAFAACSDSDDGGTDPTDPTGPTSPPAGPEVVSISILQQPTKRSYQGMPAVLTGLVAEVTFSDNTVETISETSDLFANFYGVPRYCDIAWAGTNGGYTGIGLGYKGSTAVSTGLVLPKVVQADTLEITQTGVVEWYSDERPNFTGLTYNIGYQTDNFEVGDTKTNTNEYPYEKKALPMTNAYPRVSYDKDIATNKRVTAIVGDPSQALPSGGSLNTKYASFQIDKYYQVESVEFKGANFPPYFDDDLSSFFSGNSLDKSKVYSEFVKSNVKFLVTYDGPSSAKRTKEIDMAGFRANMEWYYSQSGLGSVPNVGTASTFILERIVSTSDGWGWNDASRPVVGGVPTVGWVSTYNFGTNPDVEDEWAVWLEYAPRNFNTSATIGVKVPVTMYLFTGDIVAKPKVTKPAAIIRDTALTPTARTFYAGELESIQTQWVLEGTYERASAKVGSEKRDIKLSKDMFYSGFYGASWYNHSYGRGATSALNNFVGGASLDSMVATNLGTNFLPFIGPDELTTIGLKSGQIRQNYPLPVFYRGGYLVDEDSVLVNILFQ
jgi:hypothetical protein